MEHILAKCLMLLYMAGAVILAEDKRVLLHSDQDLYQVISSLQAEMASLNSSFQRQTTTMQSEIDTLKHSLQFSNSNASTLLTTMTTLNASLTTEVAALKYSLQTEKTMTSSLHADVATLKSSLQSEKALTSSLQSKVTTLETNSVQLQHAAGSTYVRWGRTSCPGNGTDMIYKGRMAGSKYNQNGGGANSLCLPDDPTWSKYVDGMTGWSVIYGTEIRVVSDSVSNVLFGKPVDYQDVPCALCRTGRPSTAMIPGRASCYPGWTTEYQGYVIAGETGQPHSMEYVCLDAGLEFAPHGSAADNDQMVELVEVQCGSAGSLPCPPYVEGRELSCVVCSK